MTLPDGARVLDIPCGFGRHALWLAQLGLDVTSADIDAGRVRRTCASSLEKGIGTQCLVADIDRPLPFRSGSFDLILVIHYFSVRSITNTIPLLKTGGTLIFETFGAQGRNWEGLPFHGEVRALFAPDCKIAELKERSVGPKSDRAVVTARAVKR